MTPDAISGLTAAPSPADRKRAPSKSGWRGLGGKVLSAAFLAVLSMAAPALAQANVTHTWAAQVDGNIITRYDVEQRAKLIRFERRAKNMTQARKLARDELVNEALQMQEIRKRKTEPADKAILDYIKRIAKSNGRSVKQLFAELKKAGIAPEVLKERVRVRLGWSTVLQKRHGSKIVPTDEDVARRLKNTPASKPQEPVYRLARILVDKQNSDNPFMAAQDYERALQASKEFNNCSNVKKVGRKYSRQFQGEVGSMVKSKMHKDLKKILLPLKPGQNTQPINLQHGYLIFRLCDIQRRGGKKPQPAEVKFRLIQENVDRYTRLELNDMRRDALIEFAQ